MINCINNANIIAYSGAGGIVAKTDGGGSDVKVSQNNSIATITIKNCINSKNAIIISTSRVGGICGWQTNVVIENCINEGTVIANDNIAGGIVGHSEANITNCKNKGSVSSKSNPSDQAETQGTGGIAGRTTANVNCSFNEGAIASEGYFTGGIVGHGGVETVISKCYNKGSIEIKQNAAGGIVGICAKEISDCYNYLSEDKLIKANYNVGGIIGNSSGVGMLIKNCYSIGDIKGNSNAAILGAWFTSGVQVNNCYYLSSSSLNGTGDNYDGTLASNDITKKCVDDFNLNEDATNGVTYLLNENDTKEIWKQNNNINNGFPYLIENIPE